MSIFIYKTATYFIAKEANDSDLNQIYSELISLLPVVFREG